MSTNNTNIWIIITCQFLKPAMYSMKNSLVKTIGYSRFAFKICIYLYSLNGWSIKQVIRAKVIFMLIAQKVFRYIFSFSK